MFEFSSVNEVKQEANAILSTLRELNPTSEVSLGHCYELISRRNGYANWRAYKKSFEESKKEVQPNFGRVSFCKEEFNRLAFNHIPAGWTEVTLDVYREAVITLLRASDMIGTSGSRVASLLLLSLYNGDEWRMNLSDLNLLSGEYYHAALTAIRGRKELMYEPHSLIEHGDSVFSDLWNKWSRYNVENVWKKQCEGCRGSGKEIDEEGEVLGDCSCCNGRGYEDPVSDLIQAMKKITQVDPVLSPDPLAVAKRIASKSLIKRGVFTLPV